MNVGEVHMKREYSPESSYGYNTRTLHRAFDRLLQRHLAKHGIKNSYWYFLRIMWEREGLTQRELSEETNLKESSTGLMLGQMERAGLIQKKNDPDDGRKLRIFLTAKARRLESKLLPIAAHLNNLAAQGIPKHDLDTFVRVTIRMKKNLLGPDN